MEDQSKVYLGDGVYASYDGYQIKLTSENGISVLDTIYLEPNVVNALIRYVTENTRIELGVR